MNDNNDETNKFFRKVRRFVRIFISRTSDGRLVVRIGYIFYLCVAIYIMGCVLTLIFQPPINMYLTTKAESNFDLNSYVESNNYDSNTQVIARNDDSGYLGVVEKPFEEYKYIVGEDVKPGLYTVEFLPLREHDYGPGLDVYRPGVDPEFPLEVNKDYDDTARYYYNLELNDGDVIMVKQHMGLAGVMLLIPQSEYVMYDQANPKLGSYKVGEAIEAGTYDYSKPYLGCICDGLEYGWVSQTCESFSSEDSKITVKDGQTLYVSTVEHNY